MIRQERVKSEGLTRRPAVAYNPFPCHVLVSCEQGIYSKGRRCLRDSISLALEVSDHCIRRYAIMVLSSLEPKELWKHFDKILSIPHCSGNEEHLAEYLLSYSMNQKLEANKDASGNVVIRVPATPGHEKAPVVVLQGHMDMVGEKNSDVDHDFFKDPISVELDGGWLTAKGTTLGADNGIGLEELGAVYIGCSGGGDSTITLPFETADAPAGTKGFLLKVTGLKGGHSGIDINENRGNAIKILARVLLEALKTQPCHLVGLKGGSKRNAIPREAEAELMVLETGVEEFAEIIGGETGKIKEELGALESDLTIMIEPAEQPPWPLDRSASRSRSDEQGYRGTG
jgi:dipeptidase D